MNLMTDELKKQMPALYSQEQERDPLARVKFFTPWGHGPCGSGWTWYGIEFDGMDTFFGVVDGYERELGYFSLLELEKVRGSGGLRIERDLCFEPTPLSTVYPRLLRD